MSNILKINGSIEATNDIKVSNNLNIGDTNTVTLKKSTVSLYSGSSETGLELSSNSAGNDRLLLKNGISIYKRFTNNVAGFIHFYSGKRSSAWETADTISLRDDGDGAGDHKRYFNMTKGLDVHGNMKVWGTSATIASGTITAGTFIATSDKRLKENITPYTNNSKSILDLPVYKYNFISDKDKKVHIGCLAQDLQEICPEIVNTDNNKDGYLSIEESKIIYLLLNEVKKLRNRVDELEKRGN